MGQTLTADTSEISDPDGPEELEFTYQWLAAGSAISTATAATYTIQATDLSKSLTVQVSFTDDGGTVETLTSAETSAVAENVQESTTAVTVSFRAVSPAPAAGGRGQQGGGGGGRDPRTEWGRASPDHGNRKRRRGGG